MSFPATRLRRLRRTDALRGMVRETRLSAADLIQPLFVRAGSGPATPIPSLSGQYHHSIETLVEEARAAARGGRAGRDPVRACPITRTRRPAPAYDEEGIVQLGLRAMRLAVPELVLITDVCLCQYTSHGHCGVLRDGDVDNDLTLELLAQTAVSHAVAGADIVAPSDMMDGRVAAIRTALDADGLHVDGDPGLQREVRVQPSTARSARPPTRRRRRATGAAIRWIPRTRNEALREVLLDIDEGADMVMVKPAMPYLDVIRRVREATLAPIAAYQVSGEYAMLTTAARDGLLDERAAALEALTAIKRAGADMIITYHAVTGRRLAVVGGPQTEVESQRLYRGGLPADPGRGVEPGAGDALGGARASAVRRPRGEGAWLIDADGNRYVDWVLSWGPLIAGHAHPTVVEAVVRGGGAGHVVRRCRRRWRWSWRPRWWAAVPSLEMVRFVSSGTEATMSAVRLARAFTGRAKVLKFAGGYHGHVDALLAQAGSGLATLAIPATPGVPAAVTADTLICGVQRPGRARGRWPSGTATTWPA